MTPPTEMKDSFLHLVMTRAARESQKMALLSQEQRKVSHWRVSQLLALAVRLDKDAAPFISECTKHIDAVLWA